METSYCLAVPTVEISNAVDVVLVESEAGFVATIEGRHDGGLYVGMSQTKRVADLMDRYLQQIRTCEQIAHRSVKLNGYVQCCFIVLSHLIGWRRGVVVSGVRRMNEVNARRARLLPGWVTVRLRAGIPSRYVTSQLGQLSLASLRGRLIEYQLRLG